ncbi:MULTISPECIES: class I SAM-dependent methyltransferase [Xanthomonas]|uniref:class I SAM-dependent methyltransferase n=1 Tax=Xanthomonas TaxID=338 RepID=UPI0011F1851E|nr:methyltransferase domain-containing protein [Xanthomonas oryzae]QEO96948.1 methyltransferase [Xanthomonas oryzae pv. oryzicola]QGH65237.1 methyltransferase domain-containing protein [Xanthomonas oryzae pv. oryzicola]UBB94438.1 methyltransferase domain-containing protein [Xanthomonas oryzae pv. oryzicola]WGY42407.1 methyltransferase domain-containing protein [Xanthomonas oryzae pv. oryzicola]
MKDQTRTGTPLDDWNWFDPTSDARFDRRELLIRDDSSVELRLQSIVRMADAIYDHLSVFEQFYANPPGGGRGGNCALGDPSRKLELPEAKQKLADVERTLMALYTDVKAERESFVRRQLRSLSIDDMTRGLNVNLGSAGLLIPDWLNVDAGGGDLMINVNWGLPLPDRSATFVYCSHMLEHLRFNDQAPVFLRDVHRILEIGGVARFVVPDLRRLLVAYVQKDTNFFQSRQPIYPLNASFLKEGVASLDYILLFGGAAQQVLNYNHKFGYDAQTLCQLLTIAGFSEVKECTYQGSSHPALRVDDHSYNAKAADENGEPYSLFFEATK